MPEKTYLQAISDGMRQEMRRGKRACGIGEHIPGLKCVCPSTPEDAKGLLVSAIEDPNPVLFFEHKHLYRRIKGEVPDERYMTPIGEARIHQGGDDLTVITWGAMVYTATEAAAKL